MLLACLAQTYGMAHTIGVSKTTQKYSNPEPQHITE